MPAPQTEVLITIDGKEHARHVLTPGDYVIGRNADCPIRVDADLVSRQHAKLILNYDHALIEDLGSSNGTQINGQPIPKAERTRLWPNQKIQVGTATIELRRLQGEPPTDLSLAPAQRALRDMLPAEMLREKKYDIGAVVARGGMGAILDAREAAIERRVAMKVMLDTNDSDAIARFIAEAKVTGQLEHPNIVPVHELGVDENGQPFYTMKMVQGVTLKKVLEQMAAERSQESEVRSQAPDSESSLPPDSRPLTPSYPLPALLTVFQKVCDALAFAHSKSVIHRDLKPENIMLGDFGEVLVMDWGLAKRVRISDSGNRIPERDHPDAAGASEQNLSGIRSPVSGIEATLAGTIMGTPQFMSPEQARGEVETLDARSDIYSLGAILYQILSLRVPVTGTDAWEVVGKVGRGEIEPLISPESKIQNSKFKISESLAAVVRKAMAFDKSARYPAVADLQRDIEAYQNGFATGAENAGRWKRFTLFVKRNKAASIGVAAVIVLTIGFMAKVIAEGRRAERGEVRALAGEARAERGEAKANAALADLKASAPALLQLAESEADSQRFPSALGKLDAALALDPALHRARWQRAWVLLALERWSEAPAALRVAKERDPKEEGIRNKEEVSAPTSSFLLPTSYFSTLLPAVEKVAAAPEAGRWKSDAAREVFAHLQTVEATGPALAFSGKLKLGAAERFKLADQRLLVALGRGNYRITIENDGLVTVVVQGKPLRSLDAFRGLPIDSLDASVTGITDLEPLRGMRLQILSVGSNKKVADLSALRGMPLRHLSIGNDPVSDLSPLNGMKLQQLSIYGTNVIELTPLAGMKLTEIDISHTAISRIEALRGMPLVKLFATANYKLKDCSPLKGAPLETLMLHSVGVSDLSFVEGMPLRFLQANGLPISEITALRGVPLEELDLGRTLVSDLTPLQGAPLKDLNLRDCKKLTDYIPVLTLPRLERLHCDVLPAALLPLRESATLQSIEADAYPGEGSQGARPVAEFWRAYDAWKAKQK